MGSTGKRIPEERRAAINIWAALAIATIPLLGWWAYGLFDLDEGFYGAVAAEMNRRGEWITPFYNGQAWFEKPILIYWLAKPSLSLFGVWIGPRLPSVLCAIGTYALVGFYARRRLSEPVGVFATLMLGSSLLFVALGRMIMTDLPLVLSLTGAFLSFWESLVGDRRWRVVSAALLGLGVLAKGPVAILLFVPVAAWTFWRERDLRPAFRGYWLLGTLACVIVTAGWYLPAYRVNGQQFVQKFLIEQNLDRFTGGDEAHTVHSFFSLFFYVPILLLGMAPWIFLLGFRTARGTEGAPFERYLAAWAIVVFGFFTISGAKLPHYVLPCLPPLALLIASRCGRRWGGIPNSAIGWAIGWTAVLAIIANAGFIFWWHKSGQAEAQALASYVRTQPGGVALYQLGRRQADRGTGTIKIQETSLPSLLMYLDKNALDTDSLDKILAAPKPIWIITRRARLSPEDLQTKRTGAIIEHVQTSVRQDNYRLYRVISGPK